MAYTTQGYMTVADMRDLADLHDWDADESEPNPECEAKGCDIPPGYNECRRCGAEADDERCECCEIGPAVRPDESGCQVCGHGPSDHG